MATLTQQQLDEILDSHELWLATRGKQGERMALNDAVLDNLDFRSRNLADAVLGSNHYSYCDFVGANFLHAHCANSVFKDSYLDFAILAGNFDYCKFPGTHFLSPVFGRATSAYKADFTGCKSFPFVSDAEQRLVDVAIIATRPGNLVMGMWHGCNSAHCIAGWATHLAGPLGDHLVNLYGHDIAGLMLLGAEAHNHFFDSEYDALHFLHEVIARSKSSKADTTALAVIS